MGPRGDEADRKRDTGGRHEHRERAPFSDGEAAEGPPPRRSAGRRTSPSS
jgi:hypothetical protein